MTLFKKNPYKNKCNSHKKFKKSIKSKTKCIFKNHYQDNLNDTLIAAFSNKIIEGKGLKGNRKFEVTSVLCENMEKFTIDPKSADEDDCNLSLSPSSPHRPFYSISGPSSPSNEFAPSEPTSPPYISAFSEEWWIDFTNSVDIIDRYSSSANLADRLDDTSLDGKSSDELS
jgi:hypothetical protein